MSNSEGPIPVFDVLIQPYDIEDFIDEVMEEAREKIDEIDFLQKPQRRLVWNKLIREIEDERDA